MSTGAKIRAARHSAGLTLNDVTKAIGLGMTYLSDIERGARQLPTHWAEPLASLIDIDIDELRCPCCGEAYRDR